MPTNSAKMHALSTIREAREVWKAAGNISMDEALRAVIHFYESRNINSLTRAVNRLAAKTEVDADV